MAKVSEDQVSTDGARVSQTELRSRATATRRALEVVAVRGKDVIGVRHLLGGGKAWIGNADESLARIAMGPFGGSAMIVAEVEGAEQVVNVPPKARARIHPREGLASITVGPQRVVLGEGDRIVVVLGGVQLRVQGVAIETFARGLGGTSAATRWLIVVGAIYVAALAICAALAPGAHPKPAKTEPRPAAESPSAPVAAPGEAIEAPHGSWIQ